MVGGVFSLHVPLIATKVATRTLWMLCLMLHRRNRWSRRRRIQRFQQKQKEQLLFFNTLLGYVVTRYYCHAERVVWTKKRSSDWWERNVPHFSRQEWKENFRMSTETFQYLYSELGPLLLRRDTEMRRACSKCGAKGGDYALASSDHR